MELTQAERDKIFAEERARLEGRQRAIADQKKKPAWHILMVLALCGLFGTPVLVFMLPVVSAVRGSAGPTFTGPQLTGLLIVGEILSALCLLLGMILGIVDSFKKKTP